MNLALIKKGEAKAIALKKEIGLNDCTFPLKILCPNCRKYLVRIDTVKGGIEQELFCPRCKSHVGLIVR